MPRVTVALGERSYPVEVTRGLDGLDVVGRCVVVTDSNVRPLYGDAVASAVGALEVIAVPAGEAHKDLDTWSSLVDGLLAAGVDRSTAVVAVGGGVVGDLAGFAAASILRGLPFVQVPTTLLAMVDSSVGGKTGVNHALGKNLVGAFHQPRQVWAALDTLTTLPRRELGAGLGEVVKTAMLGDADLLAHLERDAERLSAGDPDALEPVVARCVEIKAEVVGRDERESGVRAILNLGHTVGHALERVLGYGTLLHGEAVGLGLVAETAWARTEGMLEEPDLPERIATLLAALGLPATAPDAARDALSGAMQVDKKVKGDIIGVPVCVRAGHARVVRLPRTRLHELLDGLP